MPLAVTFVHFVTALPFVTGFLDAQSYGPSEFPPNLPDLAVVPLTSGVGTFSDFEKPLILPQEALILPQEAFFLAQEALLGLFRRMALRANHQFHALGEGFMPLGQPFQSFIYCHWFFS
ncbi:MAG TPA: hypothetical protein VKJ01_00625 [Candidatus Solibacter sp.]|nr:hypothetical protein [Candidatus Solibacter sp.]